MFLPLKLETCMHQRCKQLSKFTLLSTKSLIHKESEIYLINLHMNWKLTPIRVKTRGGRMNGHSLKDPFSDNCHYLTCLVVSHSQDLSLQTWSFIQFFFLEQFQYFFSSFCLLDDMSKDGQRPRVMLIDLFSQRKKTLRFLINTDLQPF